MPNKSQTITISKEHARRFLAQYHFLNPARNLSIDQITEMMFSRLGCIQFDTINVVGRNADLVLQSRVKDYKPEVLEHLLYVERKLLDGWDKVASIYQTIDWPFFKRHREYMQKSLKERSPEVIEIIPYLKKKIQKNGAMSSLDFNDNSKTDWAWGPTSISRAALETMYAQGDLGIHHRINTRRYFDLIERLVPPEILLEEDPNKNFDDYAEWHIHRRIGGVGIASPKSGDYWLGIRKVRKAVDRRKVIKRLIQKGKILVLTIEDLEGQEFYIQSKYTDMLNSTQSDQNNTTPTAAFIAPLDNLIWNRAFIKEIYNFEYVWEVYKPKKDRVYAYYVLPVFFKNFFIARVDMKYDRDTQTLYLNNWWWEDNIQYTRVMKRAIKTCFEEFISYLGAVDFEPKREALSNEINHTYLP
jgi:uncharacterized protein YcaQ